MSNLFDGMYEFTSQFTAIVITTILVCAICITYNVKVRGQKEDKELSGFIVLIDMIVNSIENLVVSIMGKRYRKLTPYFLYIFSYIVVGSVVSLLGFESQTSSLTITFSMSLVTFVMIYYFGIKYQKGAFFKKYINVLEIFTQFTPLLSMSFRLFGNILGGSIILGLVYGLFIGFQASWAGGAIDYGEAGKHWPTFGMWNISKVKPEVGEAWTLQYRYWWSGINIFTTVLTPFLHFYFDLFDSLIQSVVFTMLSLSYWAEAMGEEHELENHSEKQKKQSVIVKALKFKNEAKTK